MAASVNPHSTPAAAAVLAAGVIAALHVGKIPPAIPVLQQALGLTLVEAGFLLSMVQLAGMLLGVFLGLAADGHVTWMVTGAASLLGLWLASRLGRADPAPLLAGVPPR